MSVAITVMHRSEATKERVEWKTLGITAIEISHSTRFTLLLLLRRQRYMSRNHVATWDFANNNGRNLNLNKIRFWCLHYILQYNFWLDVNLKNLSHFTGIWKTLKVTVWGRPVTRGAKLPLENFTPSLEKYVGHNLKVLGIVWKIWATLRKLFAPPGVPSWLRAWYEAHCRDHDMQILHWMTMRCQYIVPCWPLSEKKSLRSTPVQVGDAWSLKCSIARLDSQNRRFAPILIITEAKNALCANELGLFIRASEFLQKWLWLEFRVIDCDSIREIMWKTWLELSHHFSQRESSPSHRKSWLESSQVIDSSHAITDIYAD